MSAKKSRKKNEAVLVFRLPTNEKEIPPTILELFPDHAKLIGCFIAEWSVAEHYLAVWLALRLKADAHIIRPMIYAIESSRARIDVMATAMDQLFALDSGAQRQLAEIFKEAGNLLTLRNRYAHAYYGEDRDSKELAITAPASAKRPTNLPLHELNYHFERLRKFSAKLGLIVAAEMQLPLKGPDAPESVPAHPLGLRFSRNHTAPPEPSQPSEELGSDEGGAS
jgi:hypothetical protein